MSWILLSSLAIASDVLVLHPSSGRAVTAVSTVAAQTGGDPSSLSPRGVVSWVNTLPPRFEGGEILACQGDVVPESWFEERLAEADHAVLYFDPDAITTAAAAIEVAFPCAESALPRSISARALFLQGYVRHQNGDEAGAAAAYGDARSLDPLLRFDSALPTDSVPIFEAAAPDTDAIWIEIRPTPDEVWLDGERVSYTEQGVQVTKGRHVLTARSTATTSADITVREGGAVILPRMVGDAVIEQLDRPRSKAGLLQMLNYARADIAYVTDGVRVWKAQGNRLRELGVEVAPEVVPKRRGRFTPAGLVLGGVGVLTAGAGVAVWQGCEDCGAGLPIGMMAGGGAMLLTGTGIVIGDQISVGGAVGVHGGSIRLNGAW